MITQNGEVRAVLPDTESYQEMLSAISILKLLSQSEKEIEDGKIVKEDEVFRDLRNSIDDR